MFDVAADDPIDINLLPLGSSPWPTLVTSLFYRTGHLQPAPAYTSLQKAALVFFPSWPSERTQQTFKERQTLGNST